MRTRYPKMGRGLLELDVLKRPIVVKYGGKVIGYAETGAEARRIAQQHATKRKAGKITWKKSKDSFW